MSTDALFRMVVQDIFTIPRRGTVVTGRIEAGTLKRGDRVVIRGRYADKRTVVWSIEAVGKVLDQASQGDSVGVLFKDVTQQDVEKGDEIVSAVLAA